MIRRNKLGVFWVMSYGNNKNFCIICIYQGSKITLFLYK